MNIATVIIICRIVKIWTGAYDGRWLVLAAVSELLEFSFFASLDGRGGSSDGA